MQLVDRAKGFHGADITTVRLHREHQARSNGGTINDNCTSTAHPVFATDVSAVQVQIVP
jgi:hypothetical protein